MKNRYNHCRNASGGDGVVAEDVKYWLKLKERAAHSRAVVAVGHGLHTVVD